MFRQIKKASHLLLSFVLITLSLGLVGVQPAYAEEQEFGYIPNWVFYMSGTPQASYSLDSTTYKEGSYSLKLTNLSSRAPNVYLTGYQIVAVKPNTQYTISAWVKGSNAQQSVWFGGGPGWTVRQPVPAGTYDWQLVERDYTTGSDETAFIFRFVIENAAEAVWLDSLAVKETGTSVNILKNHGFESRLSSIQLHGYESLVNWIGSNGTAGSVTAEQVFDNVTEGQAAAKVTYQQAPDRNEWLTYKWNINPPINLSNSTSISLDIFPLSQTSSANEPLSLKLIDQAGVVLDKRVPQITANQWNTVEFDLTRSSVPRDQINQVSLNVNVGAAEMEGRTEVAYLFDNIQVVNLESGEEQAIGIVGAVTADPASGVIMPGTEITLLTATDGAEIVYTLDGSDPLQSETAMVYTSPIPVDQPVTVKAYAHKAGWEASGVTEFIYEIGESEPDPVPGPGETVYAWDDFKSTFGEHNDIPMLRGENIVIDGNLGEWGSYTSLSIPASDSQVVMSGWAGEDDLSADIYVAYDDEYLYWAAKVTDNVHFPVKDSVMWRGDSIQLAFGRNGVYGPDYGFNYMDGDTQIWSWNSGNAELDKTHIDFQASSAADGETVYEARMPWKTIYSEEPVTSEQPFTILINDNDGGLRRGWIEWTPGIGKSKDATQFGVLEKISEQDQWTFWVETVKEAQVGNSFDYKMFIPNFTDTSINLRLVSGEMGLQDQVTIPARSVLQKEGQMSFSEADVQTAHVQLTDQNGTVKEKQLSVNVYLGAAETLALFDELEARLPQLESLLAEAESAGLSTDYDRINYSVIKDFLAYGREDVTNSRLSRAGYVIRALETLYDEATHNLQAYLSGELEAQSSPRYITGKPVIDGTSFVGETVVRNTGEIETRPIFFNGYGHFNQVRKDVAKFQDLGANMIQVEIGPRNVILSKDNYINQYSLNKNGGVIGEAVLDDAVSHSGPYSLKVTNSSPKQSNVFLNLWQTVTVKPNTTYNVKVWAKGSEAKDVWFPGGAGWKLRVKLPNGTYDWQEVTGQYTTGATETSFNFMILSENTGTVWLDDLSMTEEGSTVNLLKNPGFDDRGLDVPGKDYLVSSAQIEKDIMVVLQNAADQNVAVNLLVSPHYFPDWALQKWPELRYSNNGFIQYNINDPLARLMIEDYLRTLVGLVKDYPSLHSITISNEPIYQTNMGDVFLDDWHAYLETQYPDIGQLNGVYGTDYQSFGDVPMPAGVESTVAGYDWVLFNQKIFTEWHQWMADIIHEVDPALPVHSKVMAELRSSMSRGINIEGFSEFSQINGNDNWNFLGEGGIGFRDELSFYDLQQSLKSAPVFNSEHHLIADGDSRYVPEQIDHVRSVLWQGAVHGKSASTIWVWERTYNQSSSAEGSVLHRPDVVASVGKTNLDLNRLAEEVTALQKERANVAILYSEPSLIYSENYESALLKSYQALSYSGQKVGFISEKQIADGKLPDKYKLLFVPDARNVKPSTLEGLKRFIDAGGRVVILGSEALKFDDRNQPLSENERSYVFGHATVITTTDVTSLQIREVVYPILEELGLITVTLIDTSSAQPVNDVEWRTADYNGRTLLNVTNYSYEVKRVRIDVKNGAVVSADDLIDGEEASGEVMELQPLRPYLFSLYID